MHKPVRGASQSPGSTRSSTPVEDSTRTPTRSLFPNSGDDGGGEEMSDIPPESLSPRHRRNTIVPGATTRNRESLFARRANNADDEEMSDMQGATTHNRGSLFARGANNDDDEEMSPVPPPSKRCICCKISGY